MRGRNALIGLLAATLLGCSPHPEVAVEVETLAGEVLSSGVKVFRGIPFAEPPVGDLRWQAPQSLQTRADRRDATQFAPACMQSMRILEWYRDMAEIFGSTRDEFEDLEVSEDCLYLNVWTPDTTPDANLPVMVYIHGGSNNSGWAYEPDYHGHALAERGVVLVSIAYRLGVFGFLSHPELDGEALANFALWDQIAALEWIKDNIATFGGDPDRVMVFGESAGAQDILALMASRRADGLFHGAILQSNAGFGLPPRENTLEMERQRGAETAGLFGFGGDGSLAKLRTVPASELLETYEENFPRYYHSPAVDGQLLETSIWEVINNGELASIPFIIGVNADENYVDTPADADIAAVRQAIEESVFLNDPGTLAALDGESDHREMLDRLYTADGMLCPSQYTAARYENARVYYFSRVRDGEGGATVRAYHGAELPYTFGTHPRWLTTTETDRELTEQILSYWTQFAAAGHPNTEGLPDWPTYSGPDGTVMEFADTARPVPSLEPVLCRVFRDAITRP